MAHFAKLDENNIVLEVNVVTNATLDESNEEASGITFLTEWSNGHSNWKQCSYNKSFRKNFPSTGFKYDIERDAFIAPKPFNSWNLNENTCVWEAPISYPTDGHIYIWNEETLSWDEVF